MDIWEANSNLKKIPPVKIDLWDKISMIAMKSLFIGSTGVKGGRKDNRKDLSMKRKFLIWMGLTAATVFILAVSWEFLLEGWLQVEVHESVSEKWEFVYTSLAFVFLALIPSSILAFKSFNQLAHEEKKSTDSRKFIESILHNARDAIITMDSEGKVILWNDSAESVFGWKKNEAVGEKVADLIIPPQDRDAHVRGIRNFIVTGKGKVINQKVELTACHKSNNEFPVELTISAIPWEDRFIFAGIVRDITDRRAEENRLWELSTLDGLTGIANRRYFDELMDKEWKRAAREKFPMSLIMLDIDFFKNYNDAYGPRLETTVCGKW